MIRLACFCLVSMSLFACEPKEETWDEKGLTRVMDYAAEIGAFAVVVQTNGEIVASYGEIDSLSRVHSVRKAIISALVFQHLDKINTEATLAALNIDDFPIPLTDLQQTAKVIHLLESTSGINHPTGSQLGTMQADRDSLLGFEPNIPGTKWAYNNWDYNVLTTILEQETQSTVSALFEKGMARPLSIAAFEVIYRRDTSLSQHAKAGFRLSAKGMAKFGQLFLQKGKWEGQQLIPEQRIDEITTDFTLTSDQNNERYGHGYLWWIQDETYAEGLLPKGSFVATGAWGQRILVIPAWNTVVALKVMTEIPSKERTKVTRKEFERLVMHLAEARL